MQTYDVLKEVCEIGSVCGNEYELSNKLFSLLQPFNYEMIVQKSGNLIVHIKGSKGSRKIMLFTHIDEPGLVINNIDKNGFLNFNKIGDINTADLASQEVIIKGKREILGLVGLRPPHILTEEERKAPVNLSELSIDIGYDKNKAEAIVPIGSTAVVKRKMQRLNENIVSGRALCDKAGAAVLWDVVNNLRNTNNDIYIVFGVQHYNNYYGAVAAVNMIKPDIAIVVDYIEGKSREKSSISQECGLGSVIYRGPTAHTKLTENLLEYASQNGIKYQVKAGSGKNKTDAWAIQTCCGGIPTVIVYNSIKYPHSFVEVLDLNDIIETSKLLTGYINYMDSIDWGDLLCY